MTLHPVALPGGGEGVYNSMSTCANANTRGLDKLDQSQFPHHKLEQLDRLVGIHGKLNGAEKGFGGLIWTRDTPTTETGSQVNDCFSLKIETIFSLQFSCQY
ncbi:hypothetical protein FRACYDRAFT_246864 [Fragilariopsis cylindrus CCMP1102]|uniref:Uncharacterized protein n=1 Tax=Fragilariopsis cylindrus CCMP1102 TaxID=635003 RepID=A0A1E7EX77_9STRA|nr:hypothetical protein FRACYDRAFT_246864 [Fragilariopsis cylindrus CCMP1102]|eukprot:OEU10456.1 hypothetical protein FRACYDRAFT_246864 [Fragilariopsis cylindrus CCMP1102]